MRFGKSQDAKPTLLSWKNGRWVLQLEMLVPIGWELLRPTTRHIEGREEIVYYLEQIPGWRGLGEAALRIFDGFGTSEPVEDRSFEPRDGRWIPTIKRIGPLQLTAGSPLQGQTSIEAEEAVKRLELRVALLESMAGGNKEVAKLRRLVNALATSNDQLTQRISELEGMFSRGEVAYAPGQQAESAEQAGADGEEYGEQNQGFEQPYEGGAEEGAAEGVEAQADGEGEAAPEAPQSFEDDTPMPRGKLAALRPAAIGESIGQLVPGQLTVLETAALPDFPEDKGPWFHTTLVDEAGEVLGALIGDWRATVYLGGGMLLLPPEELERLMETRESTAEMIDAMSEVFNTLQQQLALVEGNPPVSATGARAFIPDDEPWSQEIDVRVDYADNHGGRLVFISK